MPDCDGDAAASRQGLPPAPQAAAPRDAMSVRFTARHGEDSYKIRDGDRLLFGRDDSACQIPVWEHIETRTSTLSRIAGELLCDEGQMWVRNLSESHELHVAGTDEPGTSLRRRVPTWPPPGRSLPYPHAELSVPSTGAWQIVVDAVGPAPRPAPRLPETSGDPALGVEVGPTETFPPVPPEHAGAAWALCAPLLDGTGNAASTHQQVAALLNKSYRGGRRAVDDLCDYYEELLGKGFAGWRLPQEDRRAALARLLVHRGAVPPKPNSGTEESL